MDSIFKMLRCWTCKATDIGRRFMHFIDLTKSTGKLRVPLSSFCIPYQSRAELRACRVRGKGMSRRRPLPDRDPGASGCEVPRSLSQGRRGFGGGPVRRRLSPWEPRLPDLLGSSGAPASRRGLVGAAPDSHREPSRVQRRTLIFYKQWRQHVDTSRCEPACG